MHVDETAIVDVTIDLSETDSRETSFPRNLTKLLSIQSGVGFEPTVFRLQFYS